MVASESDLRRSMSVGPPLGTPSSQISRRYRLSSETTPRSIAVDGRGLELLADVTDIPLCRYVPCDRGKERLPVKRERRERRCRDDAGRSWPALQQGDLAHTPAPPQLPDAVAVLVDALPSTIA